MIYLSNKNFVFKVPACSSNPCLNGASCKNSHTGYTCICTDKWRGINCDILNECFNNPCQNEGICKNTLTGYVCDCSGGYSGANCNIRKNV